MKEQDIHKAIAQYLDLALDDGVRWFHPPNGGMMKINHARNLKAMGQKAGTPDIVIIDGRQAGTVLFIEVKSETGAQSKEQKAFQNWCKLYEIPYRICRSVDDAIQFCELFRLTKRKE